MTIQMEGEILPLTSGWIKLNPSRGTTKGNLMMKIQGSLISLFSKVIKLL